LCGFRGGGGGGGGGGRQKSLIYRRVQGPVNNALIIRNLPILYLKMGASV
jgi:hypothetical protein